jgi:hypothetical protein
MKHTLRDLLWLALVVSMGCGPSRMQSYQAIHRSGLKTVQAAQDLDRQYDQVDHFITHYGWGKPPLPWQSEAFIEGRFELTLEVPVNVDYASETVTVAGPPRFTPVAVKRVDLLPDGRAMATYDGDLQKDFGEEAWQEFVASGFDLTTLGIPQNEIHPVKNFDEYVQRARLPRVPIVK